MTKFDFGEERIFLTTVLLKVAEGERETLGTGFMVQWPVPNNPDVGIVAIVTCRHVLREGRGTVSFKLHCAKPDDPSRPDLMSPATVVPGSYGNTYFAHDDPEVDVAALNVSLLFDENPQLLRNFLTRANFADFETDKLVPTMRTVFIGYPVGLHDTVHTLPILRAGPIASIPKVDFDGKPIFLIDAQVFGGSSGSPVFVETAVGYKLVGLVTSAYEAGKRVTAVEAGGLEVQEHIGIGVVFKVSAIVDVLNKMAASPKQARPPSI